MACREKTPKKERERGDDIVGRRGEEVFLKEGFKGKSIGGT